MKESCESRLCDRPWLTGAILVLSLLAAGPCLGQTQISSSRVVKSISSGGEAQSASEKRASDLPIFSRWENLTVRDGLPSDKVLFVRVADERVWLGTDKGLASFEKGRVVRYGEESGLPHPVVLCLDVSPQTGDLWIGTMGGLARFSAGRFDRFTQLDSGLPNDFINSIACDPVDPHIWVATAMGLCRYDLVTGEWMVYSGENTPMHEPWVYSVSVDQGLVYAGAWGAGVLQLTKSSGRWREFRDPDKEMEIDLLPNDGPVHDVTSAVEFRDGILWQATYVGLGRYDGRQWMSYFKEDSGLVSNFINFARARGRQVYLATDQGLGVTDGERWVTYRRSSAGRGEILHHRGSELTRKRTIQSIFAHNFISSLDFQDGEIWLATDRGASHGRVETTPDRNQPESAEGSFTSEIPFAVFSRGSEANNSQSYFIINGKEKK